MSRSPVENEFWIGTYLAGNPMVGLRRYMSTVQATRINSPSMSFFCYGFDRFVQSHFPLFRLPFFRNE